KTEITDLSLDYLNELSKDMDINNWDFIISRRFKSEEFEIQVKEGLHPENFFNLREKVKIKNTATEEEIEEFRIIWEDTRDTFLTKTDWELFKGVEKPFPVGGAIFFSMLVIGTGSLFFGMHRYKSKIVPKTKELERGWKV
ncbi:hypothetical protein KAT51_00855, partial [bacterium]|nr:hypothetical protein [bacterium]